MMGRFVALLAVVSLAALPACGEEFESTEDPVPGGPSCGDGLTCPTGDCCAAAEVPGGDFPMGRSLSGTDQYPSGDDDELPEHQASVAGLRLDVLEVTVGRFRRYVEAYPGSKPDVGAGAHPALPGSGWTLAWDEHLPADANALRQALACEPPNSTWSDEPAGMEDRAVTCVSWYDAFAFCAWDGGWLPIESEWEFAAAGGADNRLFPWGQDSVGSRAAYACGGCGVGDLPPVGSTPDGASRWGHLDLAGSVMEWVADAITADWYATVGDSCGYCENLDGRSTIAHGLRGGGLLDNEVRLRAADRFQAMPLHRRAFLGFRCARPLDG